MFNSKNNPNYKDGRCLKSYYCKCGKKLSDYRHQICKNCFYKSNIKYNISKKDLINLYFKKRNTTYQIAKMFKCSRKTICRNLIKYKIPRRNLGDYLKRNIKILK